MKLSINNKNVRPEGSIGCRLCAFNRGVIPTSRCLVKDNDSVPCGAVVENSDLNEIFIL